MIMDEIMALMQPYRSCMRENGVGDSMPDTQASRETSSKAQATCPRNRRIEVNLGDDPESQEKGNKLLPECERLAATQK
jgi:hypothetical protein